MLKFFALLALGLAEELSLQSSVATLQEHLSNVRLNGETREAGLAVGSKLIVSDLLNQLHQTPDKTAFQPDERALLTQITDGLQEVLNLLGADRDAAVGAADALKGDTNNCATNYNSPSHYSDISDAAKITHTTCRNDLAGLHATMLTECQPIATMVTNWNTDCVFPEAEQDKILQWGSTIASLQSAFATAHTTLITHKEDCATATTNYNDKVAECDTDQENYELAQCLWATLQDTYCDSKQECWDTKNGLWSTYTTGQSDENAQRVKDAQMISWVKCLVEELNVDETPTDWNAWLASCDPVKIADYSSYSATFTPPSALPLCVKETEWAGHATWAAVELDHLFRAITPYKMATGCNPSEDLCHINVVAPTATRDHDRFPGTPGGLLPGCSYMLASGQECDSFCNSFSSICIEEVLSVGDCNDMITRFGFQPTSMQDDTGGGKGWCTYDITAQKTTVLNEGSYNFATDICTIMNTLGGDIYTHCWCREW